MAIGREKKKKNKSKKIEKKTPEGEKKLLPPEEERASLPAPEEKKILSPNEPKKELGEGESGKGKKSGKKEIEKQLMEIYREEDGGMPDMTKIYRKKRSWVKIVLGGLIIFFALSAALSWAGFLFFGKSKGFTGEKVSLEIEAPVTIAGGEIIEYLIRYSNGEDVPLGQSEIEVRLPENFVFHESEPLASEGQKIWKLGSLSSGKSGEVKIRGELRGPIDSLQSIQAVLVYKPGDFNSEFQKISTGVTKIDRTVFEIDLSGPERVLTKAESSFKIKYKNNSGATVGNLRILVDGPESFIFKDGEGDKEEGKWDISEIGAGEEREIEFKGSFGEGADGERSFVAKIGFVNGENFYLQKESIFKTNVLTGSMLSTLVVNGDSVDRTMNFGDTLNYSINYQNKDRGEIGDIEIKMIFETTSRNNKMLLDWSSLKDDKDGLIAGVQLSPEIRQGVIIWNKKKISGLAKISPGEEGTINFQIKIKPYSDVAEWKVRDFEIKSLVEIKIGKIGGQESGEIIKSNAINLKINSDLNLTAGARYFNDDDIAVGSGPLPPKIGEETAYRIFLKISNSLHEVENLKVSTVLPENISWSEKFEIEAGEIKFDKATREIVWSLNRMPTDVREIGVNFEITVTPDESDKGKIINLLPGFTLRATDKSTGGTISKKTGILTSNLDGDPGAEGRGVVR